MRPENLDKRDSIDDLLDKSWEIPPAKLEKRLIAIPTQLALAQNRGADRISNILNAILIVWAAGLMMYFWTPIEKVIEYFSTQILGLSVISPHIFAQPVVGLIIVAILLIGWVWLDIGNHPRAI